MMNVNNFQMTTIVLVNDDDDDDDDRWSDRWWQW